MNALLDIREASQTKEQGGRFDSCYGRKTKEEKKGSETKAMQHKGRCMGIQRMMTDEREPKGDRG